jgi:predicted enzyme related to lactoylglutathione lyase
MPDYTHHEPGTFCWIELSTSDEAGAKKFYAALFGWSWNDIPMGEHGTYVIFQLGGKDVAAMYENKQGGPPPHWASYVAAVSADESAAKAKSLGANVIMEPFDVFDAGRMAVLQDRQGAALAIWQPGRNIGVGVRNEVNSLCWNELITSDIGSAKDFYTQLFGWTAKTDAGEVPYTEWRLNEQGVGGGMQMEGVPPSWLPYFAVDDCEKTVETAKANGATIIVPPKDIPKVGRFSLMQDPQGAHFYILKLMM